MPITKFFIFSFESTHQAMMFPEKIFWFPPKAIFLMMIWSLQNLRHFVTPFALVSSRLDWGREVGGSRTLIPLKPGDLVVSFSIMENYHGKCLRDVLQHIANGNKNILMHKIPFYRKECLIKKKRRKRWINLVLERRKTRVLGKTLYFKFRYSNTDVQIWTLIAVVIFLSSYT